MAPNKENDVLTVSADLSSSPPASNGPRQEDTASRPHPVALEVPVTVNGARTAEGSDKREPFSETTKTVLVFGNGAVIRLGSPVAPGQLLFLTNEKTKKEVVCQVVKSKNYRSVSGYVELEFTESVVGFWGMRFPSDRVVSPGPLRPAVTSAAGIPVAPVVPGRRLPSPAVTSTPQATESNPLPAEPPVLASESQLPLAVPSTGLPEAPATQRPEPPKAPVAGLSSSLATSLASLLDETEPQTPSMPRGVSPAAHPTQKKPASTAGSEETQDLKLHTARLQEQLSSMLFSAAPGQGAASKTPIGPPSKGPSASSVAEEVSDIAKSDRAPASSTPAKLAPPKSGLDADEVKIPAWLEPLVRNAAAPASTQELIEREKAKHAAAAEAATREEISEEPVPMTAVEPVASPPPEPPSMGNLLPLDEEVLTEERPARGSRKGLVLGAVAAAALAVAGGAWYFLEPANRAQSTAVPFPVAATTPQPRAAAPSLPPAEAPMQPSTPPTTGPKAPIASEPVKPSSSTGTQPATKPSPVQPAPHGEAPRVLVSAQPAAVTAKENSRNAGSAVPAAEKERISPPAPQPAPKKPAIGEVHLASPTMNPRAVTQNDADAPTLATDASNAGGLATTFGSAGKQPAAPEAPLPVGGNVTPAKLLYSVSPVYPAIAKSQHISGDVLIDAFVDATGHVTTMKVISGPALLQQASKDALRQWKYQPATLDGHPMPMHLTVKLQFLPQ